MIIHDCQQATPRWLALRMGIPTASCFEKIVTPKTLKPSGQQEKYIDSLIAERIMGHPIQEHISMWMNHGTQSEGEAVTTYEFTCERKTYPIGFISNDALTWGVSPDRGVEELEGEDGLLEIKAPSEPVHVSYLRKSGTAYQEYKLQCQGQLWVSGRPWVDVMSFHPDMPDALVRIERDEEVIKVLSEEVEKFSIKLEKEYAAMVADGLAPEKWRKAAQMPKRPDLSQSALLDTMRDVMGTINR